MGDPGPNTLPLGQASAASSFGLRAAFSPGESAAVIEPHPYPVSTKTFPHASAGTKDFRDNYLDVYCQFCTLKFRRIFACAVTSSCLTLSGPRSPHNTLGYASAHPNVIRSDASRFTPTPSSRPKALSEPQASRTGRSGETPVFVSPNPGDDHPALSSRPT
jgi:hypothetical protein